MVSTTHPNHAANSPLVSVVIPTFNQAAMLVEAIESVLAQTYRNFEIIVIDDGSTDDTATKLAPYIDRKLIRYFFQQNKRQAAAKNLGISEAHGTLIAFLDHDDLWTPDKLARQVPLFANERVGIVYCGAKETDLQGTTLWEKGIEKYCRGEIFERLLFDHFITNSSVVVRKACLDHVGLFREDLYGVDDIHLWLRICHDYEADFIEDILVACRNHGMHMKKDPDIVPEKRFLALIDIFQQYKLDKSSKGRWRKLNADYQFFLGYRDRAKDRPKALKCYLKSTAYEPRWIQLVAIIKQLIPGYHTLLGRLGHK